MNHLNILGFCALFLTACPGIGADDLFVDMRDGGADGADLSTGGSGGGTTTTGTTGATGTGGAGGGGCVPKTCRDYSFSCGEPEDGCGNIIECGHCSSLEFCDIGVCAKSACQTALEDATTITSLNQVEADFYLVVLNCVCHDPATSSVCGSNLESQTMCGDHGYDTGNITQDFLTNNSIGGCCSAQCDFELAACRNQL